MKKSLLSCDSYVVCNYNEKTKEVLSWDIPMTYTVYHTRNGTVSIETDNFGLEGIM